MEEMKKLYTELCRLAAPRGLSALVEDLDVVIYQYTSEIMGFVTSYLAGEKVDPSDIQVNKSLDLRLEECINKINELLLYKKKHDALLNLLLEVLSKDSSKDK
jgi:hypothetical protein